MKINKIKHLEAFSFDLKLNIKLNIQMIVYIIINYIIII
jgi:hypothetical protein